MNVSRFLALAATVCFAIAFFVGLDNNFGSNDLVLLGLTLFAAAHV